MNSANPYAVNIIEPERMSLLGLMVASMLERSLRAPGGQRHAAAVGGPILLQAGEMRVHLCFGARGVTVRRGDVARPVARIRGSLRALLDLATGRRPIQHLLRGELRVLGRPRPLLRLALLLRPRR